MVLLFGTSAGSVTLEQNKKMTNPEKIKWVTVGTSVTQQQKQQIEERALSNNMSVAKYIKARLLEDHNTQAEMALLNAHQKKLYGYITKIYALNTLMARQLTSSTEVNQLMQDIEEQLTNLGYKNE